jgi:SAM-dependent methyltransferase
MAFSVRNAWRFFTPNKQSRLVLLSCLVFFVELTLMRWAGANVYYLFAYANFILLASFLGMGIGFLRAKTATNYFQLAPVFLAAFIVICYRYSYEYQAIVNPLTDNLDYTSSYFKANLYPLWMTLPLIFLSVTVIMAALTDGLARAFSEFPALIAYRLEVLGSLLGIGFFSLLSFLQASPLCWGLVISGLFMTLLKPANYFMRVLQIAALVLMVGVFGKESLTPGHYWSSYSKIDVLEYSKKRYVVDVNGLPQQVIESAAQRKQVKPFYELPYQHAVHPVLNNVLIIGAGTGGDVAIALSEGAKHVDAVEIDPAVYRLGKKLNPDQPYSDPRVQVIINDGRAFLQNTQHSYDLIIFALTDSLFLIPGQSSLRLENYLYTVEALSKVKEKLAPGGIFTFYNYYAPRWMVDRLANTFATVFDHAPCLDTFSVKDYWATVLTISEAPKALQCSRLWQMDQKDYAQPSTDNHPFLYLKNNSLPASNAALLLFIFLVTVLLAVRSINKSCTAVKNYLDLFLMGAAFLLLETKSIISYALLFGTTWFVNALVFMGILTTVYLAIEFTARITRINIVLLMGLLLATLFLSWLVPASWVLSLPALPRLLVETLIVFSPIFIANVIFAERLRHTASSTDALGVNLMGAVLGGLLEYSALVLGYQSLICVVGVLYAAAIMVMMRRSRASITQDSLGLGTP